MLELAICNLFLYQTLVSGSTVFPSIPFNYVSSFMQSSMTISNIMEINPLTTDVPNLLRKSTDCFLYGGNIGR